METSQTIAKAFTHPPTHGVAPEKVDEAAGWKSVERILASLYKSGAGSVILD